MIFTCLKRTNTKIQIHKYANKEIRQMTKCHQDPSCGAFLKKELLRGIKNYIPICRTRKYTNTNTEIQKYTNRANDEVPERPNMWYIFEKRIVQGYQK